jgi:hypothetical protein
MDSNNALMFFLARLEVQYSNGFTLKPMAFLDESIKGEQQLNMEMGIGDREIGGVNVPSRVWCLSPKSLLNELTALSQLKSGLVRYTFGLTGVPSANDS